MKTIFPSRADKRIKYIYLRSATVHIKLDAEDSSLEKSRFA